MKIACQHYNNRDSTTINRYQLYLQVTFLYDIVTNECSRIHPQILQGEQIKSFTYNHEWVQFKWPPKSYLSKWKEFLETQAEQSKSVTLTI
jgi:hypothetical protein